MSYGKFDQNWLLSNLCCHFTKKTAHLALKDRAIYTFEDFSVAPGAAFRLYSGQGQDSATALYWGFVNESVWNNNGDAAYLRDAQGALVDTFAY